MKRVAFVLHESPIRRNAGVELYVLNLAREFQGTGWDVECIYPDPRSPEPLGTVTRDVVEGVAFTAFSVPVKPDLVARFMDDEIGLALAGYLVSSGAQLVHVHHLIGFTGSALTAMANAGLPVVMTVHDAWFCCNQCHFVRWDGQICAEGPPSDELCATCLMERVPNLKAMYPHEAVTKIMRARTAFLTEALAKTDVLLAASWYTRENLLRAGIPEGKIVLAPLGIPGFEPQQPIPRGAGPIRLGYLGNISIKKGLDVLLEAYAGLPRGVAELSVHGAVIQPEWFQMLSGLAEALGVNLYGAYQPLELPGILAGLDAVIIPSREESYSLVVREAFHAGLPVVASRLPAIEEAVDHEINGLLFAPGDAAGLTEALARIVGEPGLLERLGSNVPAVRSISDDRKKLEKLYATVLERSKAEQA
ncbi:glycosyltransferase [Desulfovibrio ferrophilus]|uniref:Putative group 1 glycosyl transferase n=1 Tax=Desulfovibrio ferrophilus TaxID=241368 RepID=A0A2Z6AYZ0_9BACT|nr:glycosyltransferase [Desulfovibrio ferrophilus]BBD08395.1 putative group 1 glycosyl transferase [Desulfovibrio ferrophilus]